MIELSANRKGLFSTSCVSKQIISSSLELGSLSPISQVVSVINREIFLGYLFSRRIIEDGGDLANVRIIKHNISFTLI